MMEHKGHVLLDIEDSVLLRVLRHLSDPSDAWKLASCCRSINSRLRSRIMTNELCMHFFKCPNLIEIDDSVLSSPDPIYEFSKLSNLLWPSWTSKQLKMIVGNDEEEQSWSNISLKASKSIQIVAPLQPLPLACGRIRYEEFQIISIESTSIEPSMVIGFGLPGIEGHALGKTKFSVGVDVFRQEAFEGASIPLPLKIPIAIKSGDIIGIGMCFESHSDELQLDCFIATHNGNLIYESRCLGAIHRGFYSSTIYSPNFSMVLSLNRGDKPFTFDVKGFQKKHGPNHPFFRSYLPTSHHLFNNDGKNTFWTSQRISENFAFASDYRPVGQNLQKCPESHFYQQIALYQRQIYLWQKIYGIVVRHQEEHPVKDSLPPQFASQEAIEATLSQLGFDPFQIDFNKPFLDIWNQILISLTELRYQSQLNIIYNAIERFKRRKLSIFEDSHEIRGGSFEGWLKQAAFLHESIGVHNNTWVQFARDTTLEELIDADFHLQSACPGYLEEDLAEPHHDHSIDEFTEEGAIEGSTNPNKLTSLDPSSDALDASFDPEEEYKASKMIAIASVMRAWAAWMSVFVENLESELSAIARGDSRPKHEIVPKDVTLCFVSKIMLRQYVNEAGENKPSPIWLWMQYMSLGFGPYSDMNHIPSTLEEAIEGLTRYFDEQCSDLSTTDVSTLESDLVQLLTGNEFHPDLIYFLHQYQLALNSHLSNQELGTQILAILPTDIQSRINQRLAEPGPHHSIANEQPPPIPRRTTQTEPIKREDSDISKKPETEAGTRQWLVIGAVGLAVASACIGALISVVITRQMSKRK